jgi:hypothetical protein
MEKRAAIALCVLSGLVLLGIMAARLVFAPSLRMALVFLACALLIGAYTATTPRERWPAWIRPLQIAFAMGSVALVGSYFLWES